jgi:predicted RNA-binding protein
MCLATAYSTENESVILEYVSKIEVRDGKIVLTDVLGEQKTIEGTLEMADLTGGVVKINC